MYQQPLSVSDIVLTGPMVSLDRIRRKRHFETSFFCLQPDHVIIPRDNKDLVTITKSMCSTTHYYRRKAQGLSGYVSTAEAREVMGIHSSMTSAEVGEAVPPAYAEFIGRQIMDRIERGKHAERR